MVLPCPECCDISATCLIDTDTFDSDLSKWDEVSGTWSVAGGVLDGDGAGTLLLLAEPTLATDGVHLAANVDREGGGPATVRLIAGYDDANNYVFGELDHDSAGTLGTIRVGVRVSGVETWLGAALTLRDDTELADAHDLTFCWKPPQAQTPTSALWISGIGVGSSTDSWSGLDSLWLDDGANAQYGYATSGVTTLKLQGFQGLGAIPEGSSIDGIRMGCQARDGSELESKIKVSAMQLLDGGGSPVGDIYSDASFTDFNPNYSSHSQGGPTDDLSAGITTADLTSLFGFAITFENHDENERQVEVDVVGLEVWYTTPDKTRGVVTLTYTNTEIGAVPLTQCARGTTTYEPTGKGVGIRITSGNWDFAEFTASYLDAPGHTPCPQCLCSNVTCPCCSTDDPADQSYILDLGSGWTDDDCECSLVQGEYSLEWGFIGGDGVCYWFYQEEITCGESTGNLYIQLQLADTGAECEWILLVTVVAADGEYSTVVYRGNVVDGACTEDAPFTLPIWVATGSANPPCAGSPPSTAELDVVA